MNQNTEQRRNELLLQSRNKLKRKCKALKISGEGSKSDMINRIIQIYGRNAINQPPTTNEQNTQSQNAIDLQRKLRLQRRLQYQAPTIIIKRKKKRESSIRIPNTYKFKKCISDNIDNIKIKSLIIKSRLMLNSTISELKQFIKKIYLIPSNKNILILYSHIIISNNNDAKLKHFGITNYSLLTLAICKDIKRNVKYDPYTHHHLFRSLKLTKEITNKESQIGFDIITQEQNVSVYKMPICGHLMSKQSLYHYAHSMFMDNNNLYLRCPHTMNKSEEKQDEKYNGLYGGDYNAKGTKWSCTHCTYINSDSRRTSYKPRNKCAMCGYPKPDIISFATNQCNATWHYSLIKQILSHNYNINNNNNIINNNFNVNKLELLSARNKLENNNDKNLNLQKCYHCKTLYYKNKKHLVNISGIKGFKKLKTKCIFCMNHFCWNCGKKYTGNHQCDGSFRLQIINLLKNCPTKTIGYVGNVPSIRCCPNTDCGQLLQHVSACKHMRCRKCSTSFCFVCMKLYNGRWQCGGSGDRCPIAPRQTLKSMKMDKKASIDLKKCFQLF